MVNRKYGKKSLSLQDQTNPATTKDGEHCQERTNCKNHQCKNKIKVFQRQAQISLLKYKFNFSLTRIYFILPKIPYF